MSSSACESPLAPPTKPPKTWNERFVGFLTSVLKEGIDIDGNKSLLHCRKPCQDSTDPPSHLVMPCLHWAP
ncbi:hypothetical protein PGQ11_009830 [Apiospora arundinis]|uniref:Reverse transcriptase n=1 Tax=Apiospora arundinis TaxID=335852 RepID=A0ABR2I7X9_9PEZI